MYLLGGGGLSLFWELRIEVQCVSVSEHVWVGGSGLRGGMGLPAGGIRASQGSFSSIQTSSPLKPLGQSKPNLYEASIRRGN